MSMLSPKSADLSKLLPRQSQQRLLHYWQEMNRRQREERIRYWKPMEPPYNDQKSAFLSDATFQYVGGGNRSGKTELAVAKAIAVCTGRHPVLSKRKIPPVYLRYC